MWPMHATADPGHTKGALPETAGQPQLAGHSARLNDPGPYVTADLRKWIVVVPEGQPQLAGHSARLSEPGPYVTADLRKWIVVVPKGQPQLAGHSAGLKEPAPHVNRPQELDSGGAKGPLAEPQGKPAHCLTQPFSQALQSATAPAHSPQRCTAPRVPGCTGCSAHLPTALTCGCNGCLHRMQRTPPHILPLTWLP